MAFNPTLVVAKGTKLGWYPLTEPYAHPDSRTSILQLLNTLVPYALLTALMVFTYRHSRWQWPGDFKQEPVAGLGNNRHGD